MYIGGKVYEKIKFFCFLILVLLSSTFVAGCGGEVPDPEANGDIPEEADDDEEFVAFHSESLNLTLDFPNKGWELVTSRAATREFESDNANFEFFYTTTNPYARLITDSSEDVIVEQIEDYDIQGYDLEKSIYTKIRTKDVYTEQVHYVYKNPETERVYDVILTIAYPQDMEEYSEVSNTL